MEGLNHEGTLVVNSNEKPAKIREMLRIEERKIWTIPATEIAIKILNRPITNTAMLGAVARVTGIVSLESVEKAVSERFRGSIVEKNVGAIREAYKEVKSE